MALTDKQERFILEYVIDFNATQAAIRAGYAESGASTEGHRLLRNAEIARRISDQAQQTAEELGITRAMLLTQMRQAIEEDWPRYEIVEDAKGNPVGIEIGNASSRNKNLEMLAKHLGLFVERVEHSGGIDINVNTSTDDLT